MPLRRLVFLLLVNAPIYWPVDVSAQPVQEEYLAKNIETHRFDDEKYRQMTEGADFSEDPSKPKKKKERKAEEASPQTFEGLGAALKFLVILAGIGVLIFLLVKVLNTENLFAPRNKKLKPTGKIDLETIEDNLEEAELDDPLRQAIEMEDYPLAIRLYYLAILKNLSLEKKIKWKKDKTNGEYLRELSGTPLFADMQKTTLAFERVWYGKTPLEKAGFLKIQPLFLKMLTPEQPMTK